MAITQVSRNDSDGIVNKMTMVFTTDGTTPTAQTIAIGFRPRKLRLIGATTAAPTTVVAPILDWVEGMPAGCALIPAGTYNTTLGPVVPGTPNDTSSQEGTVTYPAGAFAINSTYILEAEG